MFNVVLVAPEIPPNTGNVIRLCQHGARLHLIEPLGFPLDDARMPRGLDYHEYAQMRVHRDWDAFIATETPDPRGCSRSRRALGPLPRSRVPARRLVRVRLGNARLSAELLERFPNEQRVRLPMRPDNRSLNLSNTVAVVVFGVAPGRLRTAQPARGTRHVRASRARYRS